MDRIERSWRTESTQHAATPAPAPVAAAPTGPCGPHDGPCSAPAVRAPGAWLSDSYTLAITLTDAQRISVLYALAQEAAEGRRNGDRRYVDNLDAVSDAIGRARDTQPEWFITRPAESHTETLDRATLTDAELGV